MSEKAPGLEEYTPTRLEWLANMLNTLFHFHELREKGGDLFYMGGGDGKSIIVVVKYSPDVPKEFMDITISTAKEVAVRLAKIYGWDSWVEIQVQAEEA